MQHHYSLPVTDLQFERAILSSESAGAPPHHTGQSAATATSSLASLDLSVRAAAAGGTTLPRQSGHVVRRRSHAPTQSAWNRCPHRGRTRTESPSRSSTMHTAHSGRAFLPSSAPALEYTDTGRDDTTSSIGVDRAPWPSNR
ncbi:hypothetical protein Zm00014a_018138 [Zea mays]|uniref:Uncharacterized protein n=1 Tax=Zea mays TaxID=4577 RepID=A0A3L6EHG8_MAIZE|nr:hypothetical protein Zm00014a_018138 [Zea mays]